MAGYTKDELPAWPILREDMNAADIIKRRADLRVGAIVFTRSENRRYYISDGKNPASFGKMLQRYCFGAFSVTDETRVSWILSNGEKIPKKNPTAVYGADDVEDWLWVSVHGWRIQSHISTVQDAALLRQIADLIGYKPAADELL